jgi:predicted metal-binding membrane protein
MPRSLPKPGRVYVALLPSRPRRVVAVGIRHGIFRLGCCWALMLVKFALGAGCLMWMAALTGLMLIVPWGKRSCRRRAACSSSGAC